MNTDTKDPAAIHTDPTIQTQPPSTVVPLTSPTAAGLGTAGPSTGTSTGNTTGSGTTNETSALASSLPIDPTVPSTSASGSQSARQDAPTISLTPATPDTAHFITTRPTTSTSSPTPPEASTSAMASSTTPAGDKSTPSPAPATSTTSPTAGPSTSRAAPTPNKSTSTTTAKPKRKRTGFNKFLAAFGCLSAHDLEDDPATVKKREAATATAAKRKEKEAGTPPSTATTAVAPGTGAGKGSAAGTGAGAVAAGAGAGAVAAGTDKDKEKEKDIAGDAGTGGTTLSDAKELEKGKEAEKVQAPTGDVVVPPSEPTSPPLAETAGLTSGAVQPPGSGSELLHHTPSKTSMQRRESDSSISAPHGGSTGGLVTAGAVGAAGAGAGAGVVAGTETLQHEESDRSDGSAEGDGDASGSGSGDDVDDDGHEHDHDYDMQDEYEEEDRLIAQGGLGIPTDDYGNPAPLLPAIDKVHLGRKCLVLDLDETLLHSSFKMLPSADYIVPVEIESQVHNVYVIKRPGVDRFLTEMGKIYEIVVFTASLSKYADPVLDMLDPAGVVKHRLFRESCYNHKGNYVKDLSQLGRTMETSIIIDNSPASYIFHPNNAVPVSTWFNDPHDTELTDLCPFLADLAEVDDVRGVLDGSL